MTRLWLLLWTERAVLLVPTDEVYLLPLKPRLSLWPPVTSLELVEREGMVLALLPIRVNPELEDWKLEGDGAYLELYYSLLI